MIKPLHFLRITTRKMGAVVLVSGLVILIVGVSLSPVEDRPVAEPQEVIEEEPEPQEVIEEEPGPQEVVEEEPEPQEVVEEEPEPEEVVEEEPIVEEKPDEATLGEKNALRSAQHYLNVMAFSYSGLVEQLKFEGYTHAEAVYGVDNCGADWNEQAAKSAQHYLSVMSFSRDGLITQLEFEGFTRQQAEYGVQAVGF